MTVERYPFRFEPRFRAPASLFGINDKSTFVVLDGETLTVRFGPWQLRTPIDNVGGTTVTGPYQLVKVIGPPRLSFRDRGITFATNAARGLCICFREPVPAALPVSAFRHPAATVTVADPDALARALDS